MASETWKAIPGWEGLYEASSSGRIRSLDREKAPGGRRGSKGRVLVQVRSAGSPYLKVSLTARERRIQESVHVLVACAFHGPRPAPHMEVRHANDVKDDNRAVNLKWGSAADNYEDSYRNGRRTTRRLHRLLTEKDVRAVKAALTVLPVNEVALQFGLPHHCVRSIALGKTYKWVV